MSDDICVGCGCKFEIRRIGGVLMQETQHHSSLYDAQEGHILCRQCYETEESYIEKRGTNFVPDLLGTYRKPVGDWG